MLSSFLLENYVKPSAEELKLATLCIDYLNLPAFVHPPTVELVLSGDYAFMDYAVIHWSHHLEAGVTLKTDEDEQLVEQLTESLESFINQHWTSPSTSLAMGKRQSEKLQCFETLPFYDQLEQIVASTKKQLKFFGNMKREEIALDLVQIVQNVRDVLESIVTGTIDPDMQEVINERYGSNLFKCSRFSCRFFTTGFPSAAEREKHTSKHERPFRCSEEKCVRYTVGFASAAEREKHMRENHSTAAIQAEEFPTEQEVQRSIPNHSSETGQNQDLQLNHDEASTGHRTMVEMEQPEAESESEPEMLQQVPRPKRPRQTEFKCPQCPRIYKKRYNLNSHLQTHAIERPHVCTYCSKQFTRLSDHTRHIKTHTGVKDFVCHGTLENGNTWGCGRSFARAETLRKHHESRVGQACIQLLQQ